jgi:hypothetical protein
MIAILSAQAPAEIWQRAYERAQHQCQFPDCPETHNLEIHYINSNPSDNDLKYNLIVLCPKHNRQARVFRPIQLVTWANNLRLVHQKTSRF